MGRSPKQLRQLQEAMLKQVEAAQADLASQHVTGTAGGGAVTVRCNGQQELVAVELDATVLAEGAEMVADLLLAAANDALHRSRELAARSMAHLLPPGLGGAGGLAAR
ncbi:MAG TPA: YbaB/EbfC family nucleoid-associated protein [Verrucomicrobiae bacterium]|nr:YbaB/EbfC family nucleoid-associated protein [Verrucomicrobiae bacterium]